MAMPPAYHESLPYIDPTPSKQDLEAAKALISQELASLPPPPPPAPATPPEAFTPLLEAELARIASSTAFPPLDTKRYEAQELPSPPGTETLRPVLERAHTSSAYLAARIHNLTLLDSHGPNAWLLANYHLESEVHALEAELARVKAQIDEVNSLRARRQADVRAELESLEDTWRRGVASVLETELAVEGLRAELRAELARQSARA